MSSLMAWMSFPVPGQEEQIASKEAICSSTKGASKEALINLQKLLKATKKPQTKGILQRFLKILKWGYAPIPTRFARPDEVSGTEGSPCG